jgi:hypothetical protein
MSKLIDSAFEICPVCDEYVFLDQTQQECAREHHCENVKCPLQRFLVGKPMRESTDTGGEAAVGEKEPAEAC